MGDGHTEADFIARIDCRFPYGDLETARRLIAEAVSISPNAEMQVCWELLAPPRDSGADHELRRQLLRLLVRSSGGLTRRIAAAASAFLGGSTLPGPEAERLVREVEVDLPMAFNALAVLVAITDEEHQDRLEQVMNEITARWLPSRE